MAELRKGKRKPMAEINVVPYIDVMLVLLVVFMVTAPLLMQGVKVELPQAPSSPIDENKEEPLIVSVKADGSYYLKMGGDPEASKPLEEIKKMVSAVLRRAPDTPVLVWGDTNVPYGHVVTLMSELQNSGAGSVGLVTEPKG
ncbi:MAG: protein TolR [Cellvibrionaceae bacterium]